VEIVYVGDAAPGRMKQVYTRDSVIGVKGGTVVARLARRVRRGEELPVTRALAKAGCPILGTLHGEAVFEGGGFAILDEKTAACSLSVACNAEGVRQMKNILGTAPFIGAASRRSSASIRRRGRAKQRAGR
jgi:N-dimethylarginine dimethylaminohydrolase